MALGARPALTDKERAKRRRAARKGGLAQKKKLGNESGVIIGKGKKSEIDNYRY